MIGFLKLSARRLLHGALLPGRVGAGESRGLGGSSGSTGAPYGAIQRDLRAALEALSSPDSTRDVS